MKKHKIRHKLKHKKTHFNYLHTYALIMTVLSTLLLFGYIEASNRNKDDFEAFKKRTDNIERAAIAYEHLYQISKENDWYSPKGRAENSENGIYRDYGKAIEEAFGDQADTAKQIAFCESGIRAEATNKNKNGTTDTGIFQINSIHQIPEKYLKDPLINIRVAKVLYDRQGWNPWVCARKLGIK